MLKPAVGIGSSDGSISFEDATRNEVSVRACAEPDRSGDETVRIRMVLHYDGADFSGWQYQPDSRTVQGQLEATLRRLLGKGGGRVKVVGAGRTDSGVHATGQVAAVDVPIRWSARELRSALNATVGKGIWIESASVARPDFHPRYHARARTYLYRVGTDSLAASPHEVGRCWPLRLPLDVGLLARGSELLLGSRSFELFARAGQSERGHVCTVSGAEWVPWRLGTAFRITANRFLHRMVRYLVGTLVDVARGRRPLSDIDGLLLRKPGLVTSPPAPPSGLFLERVDYEPALGQE